MMNNMRVAFSLRFFMIFLNDLNMSRKSIKTVQVFMRAPSRKIEIKIAAKIAVKTIIEDLERTSREAQREIPENLPVLLENINKCIEDLKKEASILQENVFKDKEAIIPFFTQILIKLADFILKILNSKWLESYRFSLMEKYEDVFLFNVNDAEGNAKPLDQILKDFQKVKESIDKGNHRLSENLYEVLSLFIGVGKTLINLKDVLAF